MTLPPRVHTYVLLRLLTDWSTQTFFAILVDRRKMSGLNLSLLRTASISLVFFSPFAPFKTLLINLSLSLLINAPAISSTACIRGLCLIDAISAVRGNHWSPPRDSGFLLLSRIFSDPDHRTYIRHGQRCSIISASMIICDLIEKYLHVPMLLPFGLSEIAPPSAFRLLFVHCILIERLYLVPELHFQLGFASKFFPVVLVRVRVSCGKSWLCQQRMPGLMLLVCLTIRKLGWLPGIGVARKESARNALQASHVNPTCLIGVWLSDPIHWLPLLPLMHRINKHYHAAMKPQSPILSIIFFDR